MSIQHRIAEGDRCEYWILEGFQYPSKIEPKKLGAAHWRPLSVFGSPTWARTRDLRINSPALYRLSYRGIAFREASQYSVFFQELKIRVHSRQKLASSEA